MDTCSAAPALSRRHALAGAGAAFLAPVATLASDSRPQSPETALAALWREVQALDKALDAHAPAIEAATGAGGIPGWMRLDGEVNRLGEERYRRLIAIINGPVSTQSDLAIKAQASLHPDIRQGAFTWAGETIALSVMERLGQAVG